MSERSEKLQNLLDASNAVIEEAHEHIENGDYLEAARTLHTYAGMMDDMAATLALAHIAQKAAVK